MCSSATRDGGAQGCLYALGIGPGDPQLITLRARDLLQRLRVLVYPAPPSGESLVRRIAAPHLSGERVEMPMPMSLDPKQFPDLALYRATARRVERYLAAGEDVGYLCEGDSTLYGSFFYLFDCLADSVAVVVVPGVSAPMAGASALLLSLAQKEQRLSILPASVARAQLQQSLQHCERAVFVKLGRHFAKVYRLLQEEARLENAFYIEYVGFPHQRHFPLVDLAQDFSAPYFSMILLDSAKSRRAQTTGQSR